MYGLDLPQILIRFTFSDVCYSTYIKHFPYLTVILSKTEDRIDGDLDKYKTSIADLLQEFERRFQVFTELSIVFACVCSPFAVNPAEMPGEIQLEVIDLQCDTAMKDIFASVDINTFHKYLVPKYPRLTA